jgi:hypothetical protein
MGKEIGKQGEKFAILRKKRIEGKPFPDTFHVTLHGA